MSNNARNEFTMLLTKFREQEEKLPQRIKWKLNYMVRTIEGEEVCAEDLPLEYGLELGDLQNINKADMVIIFNEILKTLFMDDLVIDKKCKTKRKGFFCSWEDSYFRYDQKYLYVNCSQRTHKYPFDQIFIDNIKKQKLTFELYFKKNLEMTMKFSNEASFKTSLNKIEEIIENTHKSSKLIEVEEDQQRKSNDSQIYAHGREEDRISDPKSYSEESLDKNSPFLESNKSIDIIESKPVSKTEVPTQSSIHEPTEKSQANIVVQLPNGSIFKENSKLNLLKNEFVTKLQKKNLIISEHRNDPKVFIQVRMNCKDSLQKLASYMVIQKDWNTSILSEDISLGNHNQILSYRVFKSQSLMNKSRQTYSLIEYKPCWDRKQGYIVEESLFEHETQVYTRGDIRTVMFLEKQGQRTTISIEAQFDAKGYCQAKHSREMLFHMYKDILFFEDYFRICSIKDSKAYNFFTYANSQPEQKSQKSDKNQTGTLCTPKKKAPRSGRSGRQTQQVQMRIEQYMLKSPIDIPQTQFTDAIIKKENETYYLKKLFVSDILKEFDDYRADYSLRAMLQKGGEYRINDNKELVFINEATIQSQKDTLKYVIKQIGANIINGKSVMHVSLPVDIFEPRSLLERNASAFGCAPSYLVPVAEVDTLTQMKSIFTFVVSIPTLEVLMLKPFNPILGETFQGYLAGIPIFYEQISHHPPISSFYMKCPEFFLYGHLNAFADVGLNSAVGGNLGNIHVIFKNGTHFECYFPPCEISGLIYGERKFRAYGRGYIIQQKEKMFCEFSIEKQKKGVYEKTKTQKMRPGDVLGGIYTVNDKFLKFFKGYSNLRKFPGISKEHIDTKLSSISGVWFQALFIDEIEANTDVKIYPIQYMYPCLPSNCNFRLDVLYHRKNDEVKSQKEKEALEVLQRADRKLRERHSKNKNKS